MASVGNGTIACIKQSLWGSERRTLSFGKEVWRYSRVRSQYCYPLHQLIGRQTNGKDVGTLCM